MNNSNNMYTEEIADRLKKIRISRNFTQEKMAELLGIAHYTYVKMENAYQNLTVRHLINICKILDVNSDTILFGTIDEMTGLNFNEFIKYSEIFDNEELKNTRNKIDEILKLKELNKKHTL